MRARKSRACSNCALRARCVRSPETTTTFARDRLDRREQRLDQRGDRCGRSGGRRGGRAFAWRALSGPIGAAAGDDDQARRADAVAQRRRHDGDLAVGRDAQAAPPALDRDLGGAHGVEVACLLELAEQRAQREQQQAPAVVGNRVNCTGTCWSSVQVPLGKPSAAADGSLSASFTVPDGLGGWHAVQLLQNGKVVAQVPYFVNRSFVSISKTVKAGQRFTIHLKGVGWTQIDNTLAVVYDNSLIGYGCGFNSQGDVTMNLLASGKPGTHLVDIYPMLYTQQPAYAYPPARDDAAAQLQPGCSWARPRVQPPGDASRDHRRQVGDPGNRGRGAPRGAPLPQSRRIGGAGSHQFQRPRIAISDGTRTIRTSVASRKTASASPTPSSCSPGTRPTAKPRNAAIMIAAAAVTIRPVR